MKKKELKEAVSIIGDIARKVSLKLVSSKIVSPIPVPYELRGTIKDKVEFDEMANPVLRITSDDVPLKVLTLKKGIKALIRLQDNEYDVFDVEIVEAFDTHWQESGFRFLTYELWDPKPYADYFKDSRPIDILAVATGLWALQNLNSKDVVIDCVEGSRVRIENALQKIATELERLKKFEIK